MQIQKYQCRHCGKEVKGFNCGCNERFQQKDLWNKQKRTESKNKKIQ